MKYSLLAIGLFMAGAAGAGIFQCHDGEVMVFLDRPCGEGARPFVPDGAFSVIAVDPRIDAIVERNREYIEARRQARREAAARARQRAEESRRLNASGVIGRRLDRQRTVRRTTSEATPRTTSEATPRTTSEATPRTTSETTPRTTSEATRRTISEATVRTHGHQQR